MEIDEIFRELCAIDETFVEVTFEALTEELTEATIVVKDSADVVREVVAQDLAVGATVAQFDFTTPVLTADLKGVWTVDGVEYSFVELELVADIVTASAPTVNQVELFNLLTELGMQNLNADLIADYATAISTASPAPLNAADVQAIIDEINEDEMDDAAEAAVVKVVVDATNQIQLLAALQANFDRVNSAFIADYAIEVVGTPAIAMLALVGPTNYFGETNGVDMDDIQAAIDSANAAAILAADTIANTATKQAAVTVLIQNWVEADDPATPLLTPKADAIEESNINRLGFVVAEATTQNSLYNALVAYANATTDTVLKASELNTNLKAEYLVELNAGTVRADAVTGFTGDSTQVGTTYDYKANVVQAADLTALNAALADIDGLTAANTPAQVKAALKELADVTAHKTGGAKFDMSTVIDAELMNYVNLAGTGFAAGTMSAISDVNTAITTVNGTVNQIARLAAVNAATTATEMRTALTAVAVAEGTTVYINLSAQGKLEVAELVLVARNAIAGPPAGEFANTAAVTGEIGTQDTARTSFIGNVNGAGNTTAMIAALDVVEFPEFQALSGVDQITAAQAVEAEYVVLQALTTPEVFETMLQIKTAAGL